MRAPLLLGITWLLLTPGVAPRVALGSESPEPAESAPRITPFFALHGGAGLAFRALDPVGSSGARFGVRLARSPRAQIGLVGAVDLDLFSHGNGWRNADGVSGDGPLISLAVGGGLSLAWRIAPDRPVGALHALWEIWPAGYPPPFGMGPEHLYHALVLDLSVLFLRLDGAELGVGICGKVAGPSIVPAARATGSAYVGLLPPCNSPGGAGERADLTGPATEPGVTAAQLGPT